MVPIVIKFGNRHILIKNALHSFYIQVNTGSGSDNGNTPAAPPAPGAGFFKHGPNPYAIWNEAGQRVFTISLIPNWGAQYYL